MTARIESSALARESLHNRDTPNGFVYGLVSYVWWGLMPLYFHVIKSVPPMEFLAVRIIATVVFLAVTLAVFRRYQEFFLAFQRPRIRRALLLTSILVGINWVVYMYSFAVGRVAESALAYFIQPLFNVAIGALFFHEVFRPAQKVALAIAVIGMIVLMISSESWPWIAIVLVFSFGPYTAIRKITPVDGLVGLSIEVVLLLPIAIGYVVFIWSNGSMATGTGDQLTDFWLLMSGVISSIPMICFGQAARRLKISTLGFIQYLSPTMQFILAVTVLGEWTRVKHLLPGYLIVWIALCIYIVDTIVVLRGKRRVVAEQ